MAEPPRTTRGRQIGPLPLLLRRPCDLVPTRPKITRIWSLPGPAAGATNAVWHNAAPAGRSPHERSRGHCRNPQARGFRVPLLLSAQPADRGLRRARHSSDPLPARARRRRHGGSAIPASSAASATAYSPRRLARASRTPSPALPRRFPRTSRCSSFRPGCRWRGNTCGRYSVPPTCIGRSPNGARWRIRFRSCRT